MNEEGLKELGFSLDAFEPYYPDDIKEYVICENINISLLKFTYIDNIKADTYCCCVKLGKDLYFIVMATYWHNMSRDFECILTEFNKEAANDLNFRCLKSESDGNVTEQTHIYHDEEGIRQVCPELLSTLLSANRKKSARK